MEELLSGIESPADVKRLTIPQLTQLAEETGGEVFFPPSVDDMAASFKSIEEELRSQYALVYTPADFKTDGSFRNIYLYCYDRHYQVRAKKGYFATGQ